MFLKEWAFPPHSLCAWTVWWSWIHKNAVKFYIPGIGNDMLWCCGHTVFENWFGGSISNWFILRLFSDASKTVEMLYLKVWLEYGKDGEWIRICIACLEMLIWHSQEEGESIWETSLRLDHRPAEIRTVCLGNKWKVWWRIITFHRIRMFQTYCNKEKTLKRFSKCVSIQSDPFQVPACYASVTKWGRGQARRGAQNPCVTHKIIACSQLSSRPLLRVAKQAYLLASSTFCTSASTLR